jgi:hypothetical protein
MVAVEQRAQIIRLDVACAALLMLLLLLLGEIDTANAWTRCSFFGASSKAALVVYSICDCKRDGLDCCQKLAMNLFGLLCKYSKKCDHGVPFYDKTAQRCRHQ